MTAQTDAKPETSAMMSPVGAPAAPKRSRFKRLRPFLLAAVLAGGGLGGHWWWTTARFMQSTDNAALAGDVANLSARIEGDVAEILVADNARVAAGQPLIRLEAADWQARRDCAAAGLAEAEAAILALRAQQGQQRATIAAAEAAVAQAEAERLRATQDAARYGALANEGVGARQQAERTLADRRKAEAAVEAANANLGAARAALPVLAAQESAAVARRDGARAALVLAERNLDATVVRAPFDGIAGNRAAQPGQHVRPGQLLIAVAPPPERQWVVANFKETQLARMRPGQPVSVHVDALGIELHGRLESLAPATGAQFSLLPPENATGNFTKIVQRVPVRVALAPEDAARLALLRPGLSVTAEVDTRDDPDAPRGLFSAAAAALRHIAE
jgi:membrane fusion protein (multidrug efflux system)